eukprot:GDKI01010894.1.p2 GENE.GDKI01010894.1~~GDKI01010894.1.p2  ORF type:complete len:102 (-),score=32.56 GDKI01010894.1:105-410(-)
MYVSRANNNCRHTCLQLTCNGLGWTANTHTNSYTHGHTHIYAHERSRTNKLVDAHMRAYTRARVHPHTPWHKENPNTHKQYGSTHMSTNTTEQMHTLCMMP